jgi:hypothetical protein
MARSGKPLFVSLRDPVVLLMIVFLGSASSASLKTVREYRGIDYYVFWVFAQAARESTLTDIYDWPTNVRRGYDFYDRADRAQESLQHLAIAGARRGELLPVSTPFLFTCFGPIVTGHYEFDIRLFHVLSLSAALAAIAYMARSLGCRAGIVVAAMAYFAGAYEPVQIDIQVGNVNRLQLGMIGFLLWVLRRRAGARAFFAAGAVLGATIAFKPNLAIVFAFLVGFALIDGWFSKAVWIAVGAAAGAGVAVAVSCLYFGSMRCWIEWLRFFPSFLSGETLLRATNRSLAQAIREWTGLRLSGMLLAGLLASVFAVAALGRRARNRAASTPAAAHDAYLRDFAAVRSSRLAALSHPPHPPHSLRDLPRISARRQAARRSRFATHDGPRGVGGAHRLACRLRRVRRGPRRDDPLRLRFDGLCFAGHFESEEKGGCVHGRGYRLTRHEGCVRPNLRTREFIRSTEVPRRRNGMPLTICRI